MNAKDAGLEIVCAAMLSGCVSTSDVLEVGQDTYSVFATSYGYRSAATARQYAFEAGASKCTGK